jgi:hypothetical protein
MILIACCILRFQFEYSSAQQHSSSGAFFDEEEYEKLCVKKIASMNYTQMNYTTLWSISSKKSPLMPTAKKVGHSSENATCQSSIKQPLQSLINGE